MVCSNVQATISLRLRVHEIASALGIVSERVHDILCQINNTKELSARFEKRFLKVDQKPDRITCSKDIFSSFSGTNRTFVIPLGIKEQSIQWDSGEESITENMKTIPSAETVGQDFFCT